MKTKKTKCPNGRYICDVKNGKITRMYYYEPVGMITVTTKGSKKPTVFKWDAAK